MSWFCCHHRHHCLLFLAALLRTPLLCLEEVLHDQLQLVTILLGFRLCFRICRLQVSGAGFGFWNGCEATVFRPNLCEVTNTGDHRRLVNDTLCRAVGLEGALV